MQDYTVLAREYGMRGAVQHTDLARTAVSGFNFCSRQAERAAVVSQAVLRLLPSRPRWTTRVYHWATPVSASSATDDDVVVQARARVEAARARVAAARSNVGGARATAAAVGGGVLAAVAVI